MSSPRPNKTRAKPQSSPTSLTYQLGSIMTPDVAQRMIRDHIHALSLEECVLNYGNVPEFVLSHPDLEEDPNDLLLMASEFGLVYLVEVALDMGGDPNAGLYGASVGGHVAIAQLMLNMGADQLDRPFGDACFYGNLDIVLLLIHHVETSAVPYGEDGEGLYYDRGLSQACKGGHLAIVELMISKGANDWDQALSGACKGGQLAFVRLMIEKGATDFNSGLESACNGGELEAAQMMVALGATDFDAGLCQACMYAHLDLVDYMIMLGADDWNGALEAISFGTGDVDLAIFIIAKARASNRELGNLDNVYTNALGSEHDDLAALLFSMGARDLFQE